MANNIGKRRDYEITAGSPAGSWCVIDLHEPIDSYMIYASGTVDVSEAWAVTSTGTPKEGMSLDLYVVGTITFGTGYLTIFGKPFPLAFNTGLSHFRLMYMNAAWYIITLSSAVNTTGVLYAFNTPVTIPSGTASESELRLYNVDTTKYLTTDGDTLLVEAEFTRGASASVRSSIVRFGGTLMTMLTTSADSSDARFVHRLNIRRVNSTTVELTPVISNVTTNPHQLQNSGIGAEEGTVSRSVSLSGNVALSCLGQDLSSLASVSLKRLTIIHIPKI